MTKWPPRCCRDKPPARCLLHGLTVTVREDHEFNDWPANIAYGVRDVLTGWDLTIHVHIYGKERKMMS